MSTTRRLRITTTQLTIWKVQLNLIIITHFNQQSHQCRKWLKSYSDILEQNNRNHTAESYYPHIII